jgi:hypothetical protein
MAAYDWLPHAERLGLKVPKCYFSRQIEDTEPGLLIIEDLSLAPNKGALVADKLSEAQAEEVSGGSVTACATVTVQEINIVR